MNRNRQSDNFLPRFDTNTNYSLKKYLPVSDLERKWGFIIHDIGHNVVPPYSEYPTKGHPGSHMFSWEKGRVLNEYQFVFITQGKGLFENKNMGAKKLNAGDGFLIFPGEWHRHKPLKKTGWTENWVGFSGRIPDIIMKDTFFNKQQNVIYECGNMIIKNHFQTLFHLIAEEQFGYQRIASGVCLQLIAELCNIQKGSGTAKQVNSLISKVKYLMFQKINETIDFQVFCINHGISYSKFRSDFKKETGYAPLQYFHHLKIEKAKELLNNTNLRAKEIAFQLGFKSDHYFGRIFKMKTGISPLEYRRQNTDY